MSKFFALLLLLAAGGYYWYYQRTPTTVIPEELKSLLITHEDFDAKVLRAPKPALVLFADYLSFDPTFARVQRDCDGKVLVFVVDLAREPELVKTYRIRDETDSRRGTHNILLFDQGREVKRIDPFDIQNGIINSHTDIRDHLLAKDPPQSWRDNLRTLFAGEIEAFAGCR